MVGSVNVEVTVHALTSPDEPGVDGGDAARLRGVKRRIVTLLAETGLGHFEQLLMRRPVRVVTVGAAFHHWRVLPEEWPALLSVAGEADFVYGAGDEELLVR